MEARFYLKPDTVRTGRGDDRNRNHKFRKATNIFSEKLWRNFSEEPSPYVDTYSRAPHLYNPIIIGIHLGKLLNMPVCISTPM